MQTKLHVHKFIYKPQTFKLHNHPNIIGFKLLEIAAYVGLFTLVFPGERTAQKYQ